MKNSLHRYVARSQRGILTIFVILCALFALLEFVLGITYGWMASERCFPLLDCNIGPFGFDALVHFTSGLATGVFFALLVRGSLREKTLRRQLFDLLVFGFCIVFAWELIEWIGDLINFGAIIGNFLDIPNQVLQLSRLDTIGDVIFGSIGTFLAGVLGIIFRKDARSFLRRGK